MTTDPDHVHDVVVVGGRAAGAATAMLLARLGHDVVVVDRSDPGADCLSTHSIARTGSVLLQRWGLLDEIVAGGAPPIRQVAFHHGPSGSRTVRTVRTHAGLDYLVAPRRHLLDPLLLDAAVTSGAAVHQPATAESLLFDDDGRVSGVVVRDRSGARSMLRSRHLVGADGVRSRVAAAVGAPVLDDRGVGGATLYAYFAGPWSGIEIVVADHFVGGVFPTHFGEAAVWVSAPGAVAAGLRAEGRTPLGVFDELVDRLGPGLRRLLDDARRTSPVRAASGLPNQRRQPHGPGWALVGDAGYHRDPITGHGLSDAFRDAHLLAYALDAVLVDGLDERAALGAYHQARDTHSQAVFDITCRLSTYPAADEIVALQRALAVAIDVESAALAVGEPLLPATQSRRTP